MIKQSTIAILTFFLRKINAFLKRKLNRKMRLITWIKEKQEIKRMQKMNAAKMIALTRKSNIENTLIARKNILKIRKFKKLMIFKVIFEESKKILKFNNFWIRDVVSTAILRREKFKLIIYEIKIKNMFQDIEIMHSRLQVKSVKWFTKNNEKKKYALMIIWIRDAKVANKLIQVKMIMKLDIKMIKYYKRNCKIKRCTKCQKYNHWTYMCKNKQCCAHYAQKHQFAKCFY